jgi:Holliday junction resolvasome RuvABC endonuclease subunit
MLLTPEHYNCYKLLAIDPGVNNCGLAVFDVDYRTNEIVSVDAHTVISAKLNDTTTLYEDLYSERTIKLYKLMDRISEIIVSVNPAIVVCESPFYNRLRPMAYGSLLEVLSSIHSVIINYNNNVPFFTVEPLLVKKTVGAGMQTGKLDVKQSIARIEPIMSVLVPDLEGLDEHSVDAMAVGYTYLKLTMR